MAKNQTPELTATETPVGVRYLRPDQRWWEGNGRGITREFIGNEELFTCDRCGDGLPETKFPTFTVPRKDGSRRGSTCRECVSEVREENRAKAERSARAKKAAATRRAKKEAAQAQAQAA